MNTPPVPPSPSVADLAAGKPEAYAALYDQLGPRLYRAALSMLGRREDAQDAVQDVFVAMVRCRHRLDQVRDLEAYVFGALRHAAARRLTQRRNEQERLGRMVPPADAHGPDEAQARWDGLLAVLPPEQREVVVLKFDGGLTFAQIADVLGVSPNTAASRYRYALQKLREA